MYPRDGFLMPKRNIRNRFHEMASRCILNIWPYALTRESLTPNIFFRSTAEKITRRMQKGRGEMGRVKQHYIDSLVGKAEMLASPIGIPRVESWKFGTAHGEGDVKSYPLSCGGMDLVLSIQACLAPFDASSLSDATRKTLTLNLSSEWDGPFTDMEVALLNVVGAKSEMLFGEKLTPTQILGRYKAISKKVGEYPRNMRVKLSEGIRPTRYWDAQRARIDTPPHHAGMTVNAVVHLRGLWVSANAWGLVCDGTDIQILDAPIVECPF